MNTKQEIYNFIKKRKHVSFAELVEKFGKGNYWFFNEKYNIVFWTTLTETVCNSLIELFKENKIIMQPTNILVYLVDGCCLTLPVAKQCKRKYKNPHWLPVVLNIKK